MKLNKILITGGAGFIGSALVSKLSNRTNNKIFVLDINKPKVTLDAKYELMDIRSKGVREYLNQIKPNTIIHLAAQASVAISAKDPVLDNDINVGGSLNLLNSSQGLNLDHFVFFSTGGAIYGEEIGKKFNEDDKVNPKSPYGISKSNFESYLNYYSTKQNLLSTIIRPSNVYGPGQNPDGEAGVVSIFGKKMLNGQPVTIFGSGNEYRDYIYVRDVVNFVEEVVSKKISGTYNVCYGEIATTLEIFKYLAKIINYEKAPVMSKTREGDIFGINLDNSKALKASEWSPETSLMSGLRDTIEYLKKNKDL